MIAITVARVADPPPRPCHRVLVDRLWPRGLRREDAPWDEWLRDVAPSGELRRWYGHDPARYSAFRERYLAELHARVSVDAMRRLLELAQAGPLALLTASRDVERSQAPILADFLRAQLGQATAGKAPVPE